MTVETVQIVRTRRNLVDLAKTRKHALRDYAQEIRKYVGLNMTANTLRRIIFSLYSHI